MNDLYFIFFKELYRIMPLDCKTNGTLINWDLFGMFCFFFMKGFLFSSSLTCMLFMKEMPYVAMSTYAK